MKLLNLGCGYHYHSSWINIDFISTGEGVIAHNLVKGIPISDNQVDAVYHSHLLEHFSKSDGINFIKECYRVLKRNGIIRIAVPDLEVIARNYLENLEGAIKGDLESAYNYEWIMLELFDQTVRNQTGGEMAKYLIRDEIPNKVYVFNRIGDEGSWIHEKYLQSKFEKPIFQKPSLKMKVKTVALKYLLTSKTYLFRLIFTKDFENLELNREALSIGKFRLSGEVHQWMYDRFSLTGLLSSCSFKDIRIVSAFESRIPKWEIYQLDTKGGIIRKPDSFFIEAIK